jgi:host factor-I protein
MSTHADTPLNIVELSQRQRDQNLKKWVTLWPVSGLHSRIVWSPAMTTELETGLPSTRLLQTYLREKRTLEVKLVTGDTVTGVLSWQDPHCICIDVDGQLCLIWRSALAFVKGL